MRRRLYFLLADVKAARALFKDLLLARIEERHIHFLARENLSLGDLPEATLLQKSDGIHSLGVGLISGGITGALTGVVVVLFPPFGAATSLGVILVTSLIGAIMGVWVSGMIGASTPNTHLAGFMPDIERGRVLVMVDVPKDKIDDVQHLVRRHHPDAVARGRDPTVPAFP